ncbi:hypothetical protein KVY00_06820 [Leucobacter tenebrionis]|nr:hypothetical protein KVY00_06820 [Leucobacter tenebrionis]
MSTLHDGRVPNRYDEQSLKGSDERLRAVFEEQRRSRRDAGVLTIVHAARRSGASITWLGRSDAWAVLPDRTIPIGSHFGSESNVGAIIATDKDLTRQLLLAAGVPTPQGKVVASCEEALDFQAGLGSPVVVKPVKGAMGRGVTVNICDPDEIRTAYSLAREYGPAVLVEQYVAGDEYRLHATPSECVGAFKRLLPSVIGDGTANLRQLAEKKNELRKLNPTTRFKLIPIDRVAEDFLRRSGKDWNYVPGRGERVILRDVNGLTSGGDSEACFDQLDEAVKHAAVQAAAAVPGMHWTGVDLLVDSRTGDPYVIEVNTNAAIDGASFPVYGKPMDLGAQLWKALEAHSRPDAESEPGTLLPELGNHRPVVEGLRVLEGKRVSLGLLLRHQLRREGQQVNKLTLRIWTSQADDEPKHWFVSDSTVCDPVVANRVLHRRGLLLRALTLKKLPRPEGKLVRSVDELRQFMREADASVTLLPGARHGSTGYRLTLRAPSEATASLFDGGKTWYAQQRPDGERFRVIASPQRALVAISADASSSPDAEAMELVSRTAVLAVRAAPQRRWAAVDLVVCRASSSSEDERVVYVEEVSCHPTFAAEDRVVGGSMSDVYDLVLRCSADSEREEGGLV